MSADPSINMPNTFIRLGARMAPQRRRDEALQAPKVKRLTPHGLRHACAKLSPAAPVQPHVVQKRLGHGKIEITLNLCAHVLPSMQAKAASKLAAILRG